MSDPDHRPAVSWPLATWAAPFVPIASFLVLVVADDQLDVASEQRGGFSAGLVIAVLVLGLGLVLTLLSRQRLVRGLGLGLATGAAVTAAGWLAVLVS